MTKDVSTPFNPNSGTEKYRAIIKFLTAIKNVIKIIKFLCSAKMMFLNALAGSSIINLIVSHKSIFTILSLR
jgi:hypothetical protein